jgi:hypothetical protein
MSRCLFSFVTRACPSRPFYALQATPKTALNFGRSVGRLVCRSQGSHMNVTLPLQFCHPGLPFPTLLRPGGHPQNSFKFWLVGRLVGLGEVTQTSRCLFSFVTRARALPDPSMPWSHPENSLQFWSVSRSVGWSIGHREVTETSLCLFSFVTWARLSRPFYALLGYSQNGLKFWLVGWLVDWSVTGKSHKRHAASSVSAPRPALPDPSPPCGPPQNSLKFWLIGRSVSRLVTGKSHERHAAYSVSSPGPALPDPSTYCAPSPKRP